MSELQDYTPYPEPRTVPTAKGQLLVETARSMEAELRDAAGEIEASQRVPASIIKQMGDVGMLTVMAPEVVGGGGADLPSVFLAMEELGRGCGSVGWTMLVNGAATSLTAFLDEQGAKEVIADPYTVIAGSPPPSGKAYPVEGGFRVTGRWSFGSNSLHATHFVGGFIVHDPSTDSPMTLPDGRPMWRTAFYRAEDVSVIDGSWDTMGMRGTHSGDFTVEDVFVPEHWTFSLMDLPVLPMPYPVTVAGHAVVALGVARHADEAFVDLARGKAGRQLFEQLGAPVSNTLSARPVVQDQYARANAEFRAARSWFYEILDEAWAAWCRGGGAPESIPAHLRTTSGLMEAHAATACKQFVERLSTMAATSVIHRGNELATCRADIHTITAHGGLQEAWYERTGAIILGAADQTMSVTPLSR